MKFMMIIMPRDYGNAAPGTMPDPKRVAAMMEYNKRLKSAGVLKDLNGLHPPSVGVRVSFTGGKPKIVDGPFAEAKEVVGGYWIIDVPSKEAAVKWASEIPGSDDETVEVRQVQEFSDFPPDVQKEVEGFSL